MEWGPYLDDRARAWRKRIARRLRQARLEAGLSQTELARKLPGRVEATTVSRWERNQQVIGLPNVVAVAEALGISEERLICGCEPDD